MNGLARRFPWKWYAALLLLVGVGLPPILYTWAERTIHPRNYLAWEEGMGFVYFFAAGSVGLVLVAAAAGLAGQRSDRVMPVWRAALTGALVAIALGLVVWFCISLLGTAFSWPQAVLADPAVSRVVGPGFSE